jgi:hypothetical protein
MLSPFTTKKKKVKVNNMKTNNVSHNNISKAKKKPTHK